MRCHIKNITLICSCLLIALGTALASQGAKDADNTTKVLGCIQRSRQSYLVTDNHGNTYLLDGVRDELSGEVGHTLEVKGRLIELPKPTGQSAKQSFRASDDPGTQWPTLRVASVIDDVHRLGNTCSTQQIATK
jgi:hypothetical protein